MGTIKRWHIWLTVGIFGKRGGRIGRLNFRGGGGGMLFLGGPSSVFFPGLIYFSTGGGKPFLGAFFCGGQKNLLQKTSGERLFVFFWPQKNRIFTVGGFIFAVFKGIIKKRGLRFFLAGNFYWGVVGFFLWGGGGGGQVVQGVFAGGETVYGEGPRILGVFIFCGGFLLGQKKNFYFLVFSKPLSLRWGN